MKILEIKFKNINSLKGEQTISFDQEPLKSSGIFAITGATGSGKSTILDVITLALYNQIPRFGSKISRNEIDKLGSIVTHFTDEAWAEITYQTSQGKYRSRWDISKNRNGNWRDYDMTLTDLSSGQAFGLKKSEVPKKNTELIGLEYDQFSKSIILAQGDFAKFLKAEKDERTKLLEDITGTDIYRRIGRKVYEYTKEKTAEIDQKKGILESITLLKDEERESLGKNQQALQVELNSFLAAAKKIQAQKSSKELELQLKQEKKEIITLEEKLSKKISLFEDAKKRKTLHDSIKHLAPDIKLLEQNQLDLSKEEIDQKTFEAKIKSHKEAQVVAMKEMEALTSVHITVDNFMEEMAKFEKIINSLDSKLKEYKNQGSSLRARIQSLLQDGESAIKPELLQKSNPGTQINLINNRLKNLDVPNEVNNKSIREQQTQLHKFGKILLDYQMYFSNIQDFNKKLASNRIDFEKLKLEEKSTQEEEKQLNESIGKLKNELGNQQEKQKKAMLTANFEEQRKMLVKDEPCPLCGSLQHPYALHLALTDLGKLTLELDNTIQETQKLELQRDKLLKRKASLETESKLLLKEAERLEASIKDEQKKLKNLQANSPSTKGLEMDSLQELQEQTVAELELLEKQLNQLEEIELLKRVKIEFDNLDQVLKNYQVILEERQTKYRGTDVNKDADAIQNRFTSTKSSIETTQALLHASIKRVEKLTNEKNKLTSSLMKDLNAVGFNSIQTAKTHLLSPQEEKLITAESQAIIENQSAIKTRKEALNALSERYEKTEKTDLTLEDIKKAEVQTQSSIQELNKNAGRIAEKLHEDELRKNQHDLKLLEVKELQKENRKYDLLNKLIGDSTGKKFSLYAQELTLLRLLNLTNIRLADMIDRYTLFYESQGDDLQIIDTYQGNTKRAVSTLSGGESFIISLALALSLSDLASNHVSLDSLFIDEGFGTLDQETLDTALNTLEKLQDESGKTIGIISHVESLKERIQTQIQVRKNHQGYSELVLKS